MRPVDTPRPFTPTALDWRSRLHYNAHGALKPTRHNAVLFLTCEPALCDAIAYDAFAAKIVRRRPLPWAPKPGPWTDLDDLHVGEYLAETERANFSSKTIFEAVQLAAHRHLIHPVRDYLDSLDWDGTPRLDDWLFDALDAVGRSNVELAAYTRRVAAWTLLGAVARAYEPGCKFDYVLVLEGEQGLGKSRAIQILGGPWYADTPFSIGSKDAYQALNGTWFNEFSELDALRRTEAIKVKAYLSSQVDHYRPAYERRTVDHPRSSIFIGTSNEDAYLDDPTGNRRFWPVYCQKLDADYLARNRDQLFAEAVDRYRNGEAWWPTSSEDEACLTAVQQSRESRDPWADVIADWLAKHKPGADARVTTLELLVEAIGKKPAEIDARRLPARIGRVMRKLGWRRVQATTAEARRDHRYYYTRARLAADQATPQLDVVDPMTTRDLETGSRRLTADQSLDPDSLGSGA